jgi:hypothetical protein
MGQIIFDEYLKGLTEENFRAALNLSDSDLGKHTLTIKVLKEAKKGGTFWTIQLFLDNKPKGITIGMSGYNESIIKQNIAELQAGNKLRGTWPKNKPFWQWIKQRDPNDRAEKLANKRKIREEKKQKAIEERKRNLFPYTLQLLTLFQRDLPELQVLKKAHDEVLAYQKTPEYLELDKILSVAIAYKQLNFSERAVAATENNNQISIWDSTQNLILKMLVGGGKIEYQGIVFSRKQISTACNRVQTLKAELAQKKAKELLKKLLAQIPESLDAHIKALQQQTEQQWDKTFLLDTRDLKFLEGYNHPSFNFYIIEADIQTQAQMENWITAWIARVEAAIAAPSPVDTAIKTILKLIASSPKYGIQTYAMWLGNSKAKSLQNKELNKNYRYALKDYTIVAIAAKIETIIGYQWLKITTVGTHHLPVLILTNNGKKILQQLEQKKIKVTATQPATLVFQTAKTVDVHSHIDWLKEIQQKEHTAYVNFLNSPESVANIANWSEDEVAEMQRTLNERLKGWQVLAQWKLSKHPIKYKPLQRLLYT